MQTTQSNMPENDNLCTCCHDNTKSHKQLRYITINNEDAKKLFDALYEGLKSNVIPIDLLTNHQR
jgi:hypothetical protein